MSVMDTLQSKIKAGPLLLSGGSMYSFSRMSRVEKTYKNPTLIEYESEQELSLIGDVEILIRKMEIFCDFNVSYMGKYANIRQKAVNDYKTACWEYVRRAEAKTNEIEQKANAGEEFKITRLDRPPVLSTPSLADELDLGELYETYFILGDQVYHSETLVSSHTTVGLGQAEFTPVKMSWFFVKELEKEILKEANPEIEPDPRELEKLEVYRIMTNLLWNEFSSYRPTCIVKRDNNLFASRLIPPYIIIDTRDNTGAYYFPSLRLDVRFWDERANKPNFDEPRVFQKYAHPGLGSVRDGEGENICFDVGISKGDAVRKITSSSKSVEEKTVELLNLGEDAILRGWHNQTGNPRVKLRDVPGRFDKVKRLSNEELEEYKKRGVPVYEIRV